MSTTHFLIELIPQKAFTENQITDRFNQSLNLELSDLNDKKCALGIFEKGKTECGINGCIGSGEPAATLIPTSHTSDDPVVYYDKTNGHCYVSTGVASGAWEKRTWYLPKVTYSESETIILDNIIINEGGDSSEDNETVSINYTYNNTTSDRF